MLDSVFSLSYLCHKLVMPNSSWLFSFWCRGDLGEQLSTFGAAGPDEGPDRSVRSRQRLSHERRPLDPKERRWLKGLASSFAFSWLCSSRSFKITCTALMFFHSSFVFILMLTLTSSKWNLDSYKDEIQTDFDVWVPMTGVFCICWKVFFKHVPGIMCPDTCFCRFFFPKKCWVLFYING